MKIKFAGSDDEILSCFDVVVLEKALLGKNIYTLMTW